MSQVDLRPRPVRAPHSTLWHVNALFARPLAWLLGSLGVAPGQLSLQAVTVTAVGLLRAAQGDWTHQWQGALIVYLGLVVDRADDLLQAAHRSTSASSRYLGLLAERVTDVALVASLGWLALRTPSGWQPLAPNSFLLAVAIGVAAILLARLAALYGDLMVLRIHLATTRRLPGPSAIPRYDQHRPLVSRTLDRDFFVLVWVVGVASQQVQAAAFVILATQALVLAEGFVLFFHRSKDAEPHAAHVLARGP